MSTEPSSRPVFSQQLILSPLFSRVRGRGILRTSPFGDSRKFAAGFGKWHHALKLANRGRPAEEGESICPATSKIRQESSRLRLLSTWQPWFLACSSTEGLQLPFCRAR